MIRLKFLIFLFFVAACGSDDHQVSWNQNEGKEISPLYKELSEYTVSCVDQFDCPENIGMIGVFKSSSFEKLSICTGFLIHENIVATNSHCIPKYLKNKEQSGKCRDAIGIKFLRESGKEEVFLCEKIISFSPIADFRPDFAFFKIKKSTISPVKLSQEKIREGDTLTFKTMSPLGKVGEIRSQECEVVMGSFLNIYASNSFSTVGVAGRCSTVGGNSGSPVFNEKGEVVGIHHSIGSDHYRRKIEKKLSDFIYEIPKSFPSHAIFTNFTCVDIPGRPFVDRVGCREYQDRTIFECADYDLEKAETEIEQILSKWKRGLPKVLKYSYEYNVENRTYNSRPKCVVQNYKDFRNTSFQEGFFKKIIEFDFEKAIYIESRVKIDDYFKIESSFSLEVKNSFPYKIRLEKEGALWTGVFFSTYSFRGASLSSVKFPLELPFCSDFSEGEDELTIVKSGVRYTEKEYMGLEENKRLSCPQ